MVILGMFDSLQIGERGGLYIIKYGYMNVFFFCRYKYESDRDIVNMEFNFV